MTLKNPPWGDDPVFIWDEFNQDKIRKHCVRDFEVEQCFENPYDVVPHNKAKSKPEKYGDRYIVMGHSDAGRKLFIIVQHLQPNFVRPVTAWDK